MKINHVFAFASVSLAAFALPAYAQEAPPADEANESDDTIIVMARRREESLQDVPVVVNAVTGDAIERLNVRRFEEITNLVPGLGLTANANGIGSSSTLRGTNHDVNVSGENGTIQYYLNDAPVPSGIVLQAMYDIGQIEVLRGPQGTLRGRSTPSGSITIGARKPDLTAVGGYMSGSYGTASANNVQFAFNVPVIADKLGIRVAGLRDVNRGNRVTSTSSTIEPRGETQSIRASARFEPTDFIKTGFTYQRMKIRSTAFDQVQSFSNLVPGFAPSVTANPAPGNNFLTNLPSTRLNAGIILPSDRRAVETSPRRVGQDFTFYNWNAEVDFAGQSLYYVGSHSNSHFVPFTNSDTGGAFGQLLLQRNTNTISVGSTHEVRLQNQERIGGIVDYVVGYFQQQGTAETSLIDVSVLQGYFPIGGGNFVSVANPGSFTTNTPIYLPPGKGTEKSYFGNLTIHLGEATEIAGGLRHVNFVNRSAGLYINCSLAQFAAGSCAQTPGTANNYDVSKTVYSATIRHRFSPDLMVYAATGTSFRPPVRAIGDFSTSYSPLEVTHTTFGPETSTSYEIGIKSDWLDRRLTVNITAYRQKYTNYPFRAAGAGVTYININSSSIAERSAFSFISAVPVTIKGVEAEISFRPSRNFSITTVTSYVDSRIKNARIACTDALNNSTGAVGKDGIPDVTRPTLAQLQGAYGTEHLAECLINGQSATFQPKWSGTVQAEYSLPVADGAAVFLRGLYAWRGSTSNDPFNRFDDVGAYGLFNGYVGVRDPDGGWELSLYGKNLFNTTRIVTAEDSATSVNTTALNFATFRPAGGVSYESNYSNVTVNSPREVGVTLRLSFGSR